MATTICDFCNGIVAEEDLREKLKVGTASMMDEGMVASPFRIFVDEEGRIRDTRE